MEKPRVHNVGVIMNGVTGRMGMHQHFVRSILAIRQQGGVKTKSGDRIVPDPILVGRSEAKLRALAAEHQVAKFSTELDTCLADPYYTIYFDSQATNQRAESVSRAIRAGKAVYCEKPVASNLDEALMLCRLAASAGIKNGVVQDKLWLPGILKLKSLIESKFFGKILSVRGEFGYWVFDGSLQPGQRPSWNYRKEDGGGIITDMFCHWRYLIDNLFGNVSALSCLGATHIDSRIDEQGKTYRCTADDAAYATFVCDTGVICQLNSSWSVRVRRDDLLTLQVDGTAGSAVAGLQRCYMQQGSATPTLVWNPDVENPFDYYAGWQEVPSAAPYPNAFKVQWELFLRHVLDDEPFPWSFREGAEGIQLAELAQRSWSDRRWVDVPKLKI